MKKEQLNDIMEKFQEGMSIRKISKELNLVYSSVRYQLLKNGAYEHKQKFIKNNMVICIVCNINKSISLFDRYKSHSDRTCNSCVRDSDLKYNTKKLGLTPDDYNKFYDIQDGSCGICKTKIGHITKNGRVARLSLDHCHETGKPRGLLCNKCNRGLGYLKNFLSQAVTYLENSKMDKC